MVFREDKDIIYDKITCEPSSPTRFDGILKKAVKLLALRNKVTNSKVRQYAMPRRPVWRRAISVWKVRCASARRAMW